MNNTEHPAPLSPQVCRGLIEAAGKAPSADNNQPWSFRCVDDAVQVFHRRERGLSADVCDLFSWIAVGAAIENLVLAASANSLAADVQYHDRPFAVSADGERIATVRLRSGGTPDSLHAFISERVTNRRLYRRNPLSATENANLHATVRDPDSHLYLLSERSDLKKLSQLMFQADRVRFEHQPFHEEFHKALRYNANEAQQARDGLDVNTLELPPLAGPLLRWLRPWKRMRLANRFGMSRSFARYSVKQMLRSAAVGLLTTSERSDPSYLEAGRSLQRIWLTATAQGLAFQPLGSLPLFLTRLEVQQTNGLAPRHVARLRELVEPFDALFPAARGQAPVMLFRVGRSRPPSARSIRFPLNQIDAGE
jgi:nitroreductase